MSAAASATATDDTPVPMLVPGKGRTAQARLWAYVVDDRASGAATPALTWYRFTPDRSGIHPQSELGPFTGLLQADGYAGYEKLYEGGRIQEVACWAHFRRKIFENHQTSPTTLTCLLLDRIAGLQSVEVRRHLALPLHADAIAAIGGCCRQCIGADDRLIRPGQCHADRQMLPSLVRDKAESVQRLQIEGPHAGALGFDFGDAERSPLLGKRLCLEACRHLGPIAGHQRIGRGTVRFIRPMQR